MTDATTLRTLVLNSDFRPLSTWPLSLISGQDAVCAVYRDKATVIEEWDAVFRSPSQTIKVPKTIVLRDYIALSVRPKYCKPSVRLRDRFRCQYCGERFPASELTNDHVIPRAAGGQTDWTNILSCCKRCNDIKRDRLPNYSGRRRAGDMRPLKPPRQPTTAELLRAGLEFLDPAIRRNWGTYLQVA